jgi:superfamily II DNA or RNA helicase
MKAVLSNRIYLDVTPEVQEELDKELTYVVPPKNPRDLVPQVIKNMAVIRPGIVTIPIGRIDLIPPEYEIIDKRVLKPEVFPEFKYELRKSQQEVHNTVEDNCIINAWVSWGKTFTALSIAGKLGQKTLVVVHTIPLRNQWAKEVQKVFGFKPGIIGSGQFDTNSSIVIGNIQTLYRNINKIRKEFGTLILDEMHHVSSPTFSRILDTNYCRYKIGLSGTIERKDGKHVVFRDYFSPNVLKPPKENFMVPVVNILHSEVRFLDGARIPWANRVTNLASNEEYIHTVAILAAAYAQKGHKVLVVSDRVAFLKKCAELTGEKAICITGEIPQEEREKLINELQVGNKNVLYGTQAIFSEGISINVLSCLILGTPINNDPLLTQLIGRIIRKEKNKPTPVVIDIHLKGDTARRQASSRIGYYMKQGYQIKEL